MKKKELFKDLSDEQAEKVVGGVGRVFPGGPTPGAGINGWGAPGTPSAGGGLISAGFTPPGVLKSPGASGIMVRVPGGKG